MLRRVNMSLKIQKTAGPTSLQFSEKLYVVMSWASFGSSRRDLGNVNMIENYAQGKINSLQNWLEDL